MADLANTLLPATLRALYEGRRSGVLVAKQPGATKAVFFHDVPDDSELGVPVPKQVPGPARAKGAAAPEKVDCLEKARLSRSIRPE